MPVENEYIRLPGRGSVNEGFFTSASGKSRLFLGKDHLLRVNSNGWTENYRRFYFTDIQAVVVSLTNWRLIWNIVHAVTGALFILWLLKVENVPGRVTLASIALFFGVKLLINALRGPTCATRIQTRIGIEPLPSLQRLHNAQRAILALQPHIRAAQGELNPDEIHQKIAEGSGARAENIRRTAPGMRANSYGGALHGWLFGVFLVEAAVEAMNIFAPGILAAILTASMALAVAALTVMALVKQSGSALGQGLRNVTWCGLVHVILTFVGGYALFISVIISNPKIANDQGALLIAISEMQAPWIRVIYGFMAGFALVIALMGLLLLRGSRVPPDHAADAPPSQP